MPIDWTVWTATNGMQYKTTHNMVESSIALKNTQNKTKQNKHIGSKARSNIYYTDYIHVQLWILEHQNASQL